MVKLVVIGLVWGLLRLGVAVGHVDGAGVLEGVAELDGAGECDGPGELEGVGECDGPGLCDGVGECDAPGDGIGDGGAIVTPGDGDGDANVTHGVGVGDATGDGVGDAAGDGVGLGDGDRIGDGVGLGVGDGDGDGDGLGEGVACATTLTAPLAVATLTELVANPSSMDTTYAELTETFTAEVPGCALASTLNLTVARRPVAVVAAVISAISKLRLKGLPV